MLDDTIRLKIEHYCAYQERCHSEVVSKLYELKCPHEDIDEYVVHLIEENFLNESRFAELYAQSKFSLKKWGKLKIAFQLKSKKVSKFCIDKALNQLDDDAYFDTALSLIDKKNESLKNFSLPIRKKKIYQYMMQKGYESHIIATHTQNLK